MSRRYMNPAFALIAFSALAACQDPSSLKRPNAAELADCRRQVDRVYNAQNRAELSFRDQRDTPFAAGYVSGVTTRGLSARYGRDNLVQSCLNQAVGGQAAPASVVPGTGPRFQNRGS